MFGVNPLTVIEMLGGGGEPVAIEQPQRSSPAPGGSQGAPGTDQERSFVAVVLGSTEEVWGDGEPLGPAPLERRAVPRAFRVAGAS